VTTDDDAGSSLYGGDARGVDLTDQVGKGKLGTLLDHHAESQEPFRRLDEQLLGQARDVAPMGCQRLNPATGGVQRPDEQFPRPFAKWILLDMGRKTTDGVQIPSAKDPTDREVFDHRTPEVLQAGSLDLGGVVVRHVVERRAAPEIQPRRQFANRLD